VGMRALTQAKEQRAQEEQGNDFMNEPGHALTG